MVYRKWSMLLLAVAAGILLAGMSNPGDGAEAPRISTEELKSRLGETGLVILDVRKGTDWDSSDEKIVGAVRIDPAAVDTWAGDYGKGTPIVLYCA